MFFFQIKEIPNTTNVKELYVWIIMTLIGVVLFLVYHYNNKVKEKDKEKEEIYSKLEKVYEQHKDDLKDVVQKNNIVIGRYESLTNQLKQILERHERQNN